MTDLPSIVNILSALYTSQRTYSDILFALVQHVAGAALSTTFPILTPIRILVSAFDNATRAGLENFGSQIGQGVFHVAPEPIKLGDFFNEHYHQVLNNCRKAREELLPAIETNLTEIEPLLIAELHGSYGLELFFRFIKHIPGCWSTRIDLLDDIQDIIYSLRSSLRVVGACLDHVEQYARIVHACFLNKDWVARHRGRSDLRWCLRGTKQSVFKVAFVLPAHSRLPGYRPVYVFLVLFQLVTF